MPILAIESPCDQSASAIRPRPKPALFGKMGIAFCKKSIQPLSKSHFPDQSKHHARYGAISSMIPSHSKHHVRYGAISSMIPSHHAHYGALCPMIRPASDKHVRYGDVFTVICSQTDPTVREKQCVF